MKLIRFTAVLGVSACLMLLVSCSASKKSGCPSNGKNVGAERLLGDEKVPKARKFKA